MDNVNAGAFQPVRTGIVGAGTISGKYIPTIQKYYPILDIRGICDVRMESAERRAREFGLSARTYQALMEDPEVELIINLTPVPSHYQVLRDALEAGKHAYTEKVMTDDPQKAKELLKLSDEKGLYLGSAPDTFLGASLQTARKAIDEGMIGEATSFVAAGNRDNGILTSMFSFLRMPGGDVCNDYGVYYLTALVSLFGPVQRVGAMSRAPYPTHVNIVPGTPDYGKVMDTPNVSQVSAILQMRNGITGTFHLNADSVLVDRSHFIVYGTKGMLYLGDPNQFGGKVFLLKNSPDFRNPPQAAELSFSHGYREESRGLGAADMAQAIRQGRKARANKEMAYHVLDVIHAILDCRESGAFMEIGSTCERPAPMEAKAV